MRVKAFFGGILLLLLVAVAAVLVPYKPKINYAQTVTDRNGVVLHAFLSSDEKWRMKTELSEISPLLRKAFLLKEDRWFYYHPGVNPLAVMRALANNIWQGRTTSGASTITMQVARLLEPKPRTLPNKLIEMFRAFQLEAQYSKTQILQLYLNLVPYGSNIEGVKAASVLYLGQLPQQLSLAQATALAVIPNRPGSLRIGKNNQAITEARNTWLRRFSEARAFPENQLTDALAEPFEAQRKPNPQLAPHYARRMSAQFPNTVNIRGTIDAARQERLQNLTANYTRRQHTKGIYNASVLVINNQTGGIEAYIGSSDFADNQHAGQVDGVRAVRSPGSTLKPYLYALAYDEGLLTPATVVTDVPVNFAGYSPENFDRRYNGQVTIEKALAYSLNIPAVEALDKLGVRTFAEKLSDAGFRQIKKDHEKMGLSLILGGCGARLEELAGLYAAFARRGKWQPLLWQTGQKVPLPSQLVTEGAAFLITETLTQLTRPDLPNNYESSLRVPKIAWKTGTSYGRRDAWSIGYNQQYTIAVWLGNFSGQGVPELTGTDVATPLLFELFNTLSYNQPNNWYKAPKQVSFRLVCSETGAVPGEHCQNQVLASYLPGISPSQPCRHLLPTFVSADENYSYCTSCVPANGYKKQLYPNLPPALVTWNQAQGIAWRKPPEHNPRCTRIFKDQPPQITSPAAKTEYLIDKLEPEALLLSCHTPPEVSQVFWYVNDRFYKAAAPAEQVFFSPKPGTLKVSCSDDRGRNSTVEVQIKYF